MSLTAVAAAGQQPSACPIAFQKVDPHSKPFTAEMLGSEKDPWDHYLRIEYRNISDKTVIATQFGVAFVDALAQVSNSVYTYQSPEIVKPGKVAKPYWGDGVYFHEYGSRMTAIVWLEKARFADDTFFVDDGSRACAWPSHAFAASSHAATSSAPVTPAPANPALGQLRENSEAAKSSPAAAALLANVGHAYSAQELAEMVQKGQASRFAVITVPPGADVEIDGNKAGVTPFAGVLIRQGDTERTITVRLSGYKTVEKKVVPDGKTIPIGLTLEKQ